MNAPTRLAVPSVSLAHLTDPDEAARIERFVTQQGGSVFHRPLWLRAIERGTGQQAMGLVLEQAGQLTGWLPLTLVHSPLFGRALVSSGFGVGGGVLAQRRHDAETLCRAAEEGLKTDFEITIGSDEADRVAHYAVYAESVHNLGTPVFPRRLFDAVLDAFGAEADILTAHHDGTPVASVLSLYHDDGKGPTVMPYWGGGTYAARGLRANERMYYELMLHARKRGCTRFDFGRSKTESGPYFFKKNWGFEPEPLTYSSWSAPGVAARNIDPTDESYARKIALWKRLPLRLANAIGPHIARGLG